MSPDLFRALAELIRDPHLTGAFRLDCKYVTLAATLSHPRRATNNALAGPRLADVEIVFAAVAAGAIGPAALINKIAMTITLS
jgi:hypothetical protein